MPVTDYQATGPGAVLLKYPILQFILTTEPVLGTSDVLVPEGPVNRELHKLLQNCGALANHFYGYLNRSIGVVDVPVPDPIVAPVPLPGASLTPAHQSYHSLIYSDREVLFCYDALGIVPGWQYVIDVARVNQILSRSSETVTSDLTTEDEYVDITIPDGFSMSDLKTFYVVSNANPDNFPLISVLPGLFSGESSIRFTLSDTPTINDTYTLVCVFEKFISL